MPRRSETPRFLALVTLCVACSETDPFSGWSGGVMVLVGALALRVETSSKAL